MALVTFHITPHSPTTSNTGKYTVKEGRGKRSQLRTGFLKSEVDLRIMTLDSGLTLRNEKALSTFSTGGKG